MLNIDELREAATRNPSQSGVGGIKLRTADCIYRFYCEEFVKRRVDEVHTHSNGFNSTVEKGVLRNILYEVKEVEYETDYCLTQGVCQKGCVPDVVAENIVFEELFRADMPAGTFYSIDPETFHRVEFVTRAVVTSLSPPFMEGPDPKFARNKKEGYVCPWGEEMLNSTECWEAIDFILKL